MPKCFVIRGCIECPYLSRGCIECPYLSGYYFARCLKTNTKLENVKLNDWEYECQTDKLDYPEDWEYECQTDKLDYPEWCPLMEVKS